MPAIVTNKFRIHNAKQFVEAFDEVSTTSGAVVSDSSGLLNTNMYLFIGKLQRGPKAIRHHQHPLIR